MLTIICGEDSISSREYLNTLRKQYEEAGSEIKYIKPTELPEINRWLADSISLFSQKTIFITEGLNKKISKRSNPTLFSVAEEIAKKKYIDLIDWEDEVSSRELKISKGVTIKEFKPQTSIFKLLDSCYPSNLKQFISIIYSLSDKIDDIFIFIMLVRHMRNLFIIKQGQVIKSLQPWQAVKLKSQARLWDEEKLSSFYDGLYRIEQSVKTSKNPLSIRKSLDLLACYFL